eukprot:365263-Chlamydomonas_euryale.AAC.19
MGATCRGLHGRSASAAAAPAAVAAVAPAWWPAARAHGRRLPRPWLPPRCAPPRSSAAAGTCVTHAAAACPTRCAPPARHWHGQVTSCRPDAERGCGAVRSASLAYGRNGSRREGAPPGGPQRHTDRPLLTRPVRLFRSPRSRAHSCPLRLRLSPRHNADATRERHYEKRNFADARQGRAAGCSATTEAAARRGC